MNADAWRGRRVLVTGHTGFKGAWLVRWLREHGAHVEGLALAPATAPSLAALLHGADGGDGAWLGDVRDLDTVRAAYARAQPEVVFHLAAAALVRPAYADPVATFATNALGTAHVLEAARGPRRPRAVVVVTSDKVYDPDASRPPFDEAAPLGGHDPYSASKVTAELVTTAYRDSYLDALGIAVATARAGNVIGGGDWATDRLVPDFLRARAANEPLVLRYPDAVRPWQHVLDPLHGYLVLAERLLDDPGSAPSAVNFGPAADDGCTVAELVERLTDALGFEPGWQRGPAPELRETAELRLSSHLATEALGWKPRLTLDDALGWTAEWYAAYEQGDDADEITARQIRAYEAIA